MTELKMCPFCGEQIYYEVPKGSMDFDGHCWNKNCFMYGIEITFGDIAKYNTRPIEDELEARIAQLTAEIKRLKAVLNEWDMAWLTDCIAPQPNGNEAFGLDEGLVLCALMMNPILEETRLLLGKAEVVR